MQILYINLASQNERREFVEKNFADCNYSGWKLNRVDATPASAMREEDVPGDLSWNEKACYRSHERAIRQAMDNGGHAFIVEDDVLFGQLSTRLIDGVVNGLDPDSWDLLFTDIAITDPGTMLDLFRRKRHLKKTEGIVVENLAEYAFAGATAYVVNARSVRKVLALIEAQRQLDVPYDLLLRELAQKGALKVRFAFPFLTSISKYADQSQIQSGAIHIADVVWNSFRRFVWLEGDCAVSDQAMQAVIKDYDDKDVDSMLMILRVFLSEKFEYK